MFKKLIFTFSLLFLGLIAILFFSSGTKNKIKASELYNQKKGQYIINYGNDKNTLVNLNIKEIEKKYIENKNESKKFDFELLKLESDVIIEGKVLETVNLIGSEKPNSTITNVYVKVDKVLKGKDKVEKNDIIRIVEKGGLYTKSKKVTENKKNYIYMTNNGVMTSEVQERNIYFLENNFKTNYFNIVGEYRGRFKKNIELKKYIRPFKDYDIYEHENAAFINGVDMLYEDKINKEVSKYYNDN